LGIIRILKMTPYQGYLNFRSKTFHYFKNVDETEIRMTLAPEIGANTFFKY